MQPQLLQNGFCISRQRFVLFVAFLWKREFEELHFLKLMLAENSARIFSRGARFRAEARCPGRNMDGKFVLGNGFVAIKIVQFDFGCRCKPKVGVLDFEEIGGEFRQLPRTPERRRVYQKWWESFRVGEVTPVHVQE